MNIKNILLIILLGMNLTATAQHFHKNPVIAHRGAWKNTGHPENSLASFKAAADMGCHGSEFDVWFTAEDSMVVYHDSKRNGKLIEETSFAELRSQRLKNGEKIPTLDEYLAFALKQKKTKLIIDIKTFVKNPERTVKLALAIHKRIMHLGAASQTEYLAGYIPAILALQRITDIPVAYLGKWRQEMPECYPAQMRLNGIKFADFQDERYLGHPDWTQQFKKDKVHLNVWTVDKDEDIRYFLHEGFNYITTNEPERVLQLYKQNRRTYDKAARF